MVEVVRRRRLGTWVLGLLALAGAGAVRADEAATTRGANPLITLQNDTLQGGQSIAVQIGFVDYEVGAAVFYPDPAIFPVKLREVQVFWKSLFGNAEPTVEEAIRIYTGVPFEEIVTLEFPAMQDGGLNVFDLTPLNVILTNPTPIVVGLEFFEGPAGDVFRASLCSDVNGCGAGLNYVRDTIKFEWTDMCSFGMSGNLIIRCKVESMAPDEPCVGDVNGDGIVNTADMGLLLAEFGNSIPLTVPGADVNGDGTVNTPDLGLLIGNFGVDCEP